jgi:hypothetical protein
MKQPVRYFRDFIHRTPKRSFVCLRRFAKPTYLPHELKRSIPNLLFSNGRIEIEKNLDVSAHLLSPQDVATLDLQPQKTIPSYPPRPGSMLRGLPLSAFYTFFSRTKAARRVFFRPRPNFSPSRV